MALAIKTVSSYVLIVSLTEELHMKEGKHAVQLKRIVRFREAVPPAHINVL